MAQSTPLLPNAADKVAFVTGATGGIGQVCVKMFLEAGCNVVATGRRAVAGDDPRLLKLSLEVSDEAQVIDAIAKTKARFGAIDY
ncbi:MAG: SDR family NAD(P)-dependent oxidoreductase, partial [Alphaproteobacteria bacterium]|nr:SDR family NAD(P)-dependent oxidoreductase [Alphaproteobacteria bacterium]